MQICEYDLVLFDELIFGRQGFFDMHHHGTAFINFSGCIYNFSAGFGIKGVCEPAVPAGIFLHQHRMPVVLHYLHPGRGHGNTMFFGFDFF